MFGCIVFLSCGGFRGICFWGNIFYFQKRVPRNPLIYIGFQVPRVPRGSGVAFFSTFFGALAVPGLFRGRFLVPCSEAAGASVLGLHRVRWTMPLWRSA